MNYIQHDFFFFNSHVFIHSFIFSFSNCPCKTAVALNVRVGGGTSRFITQDSCSEERKHTHTPIQPETCIKIQSAFGTVICKIYVVISVFVIL